jgi:hypothetical protein
MTTLALVTGIPLAGLLAWYVWYRIEYKARGIRHNSRLCSGYIITEGETAYQMVTDALVAAGKARTATNPGRVEVERPGGRFPSFTTKTTLLAPIHLSDDRTIAGLLFQGNDIQTEYARALARTLCLLGDKDPAKGLEAASRHLHELDGKLKTLAEQLSRHLPAVQEPDPDDVLDLDIGEDIETGGSD